jgi:hypothetical protein
VKKNSQDKLNRLVNSGMKLIITMHKGLHSNLGTVGHAIQDISLVSLVVVVMCTVRYQIPTPATPVTVIS